jgi:DNA-binding MarR family transcriptional regulator
MPSSERLPQNEDLEGKVLLSNEDARAAARLIRLLSDAVGHIPELEDSSAKLSDDQLASRAQFIIHSRRIRARHFQRSMLGEPAWDVLLLVYAGDVSGDRLTPTKLARLTGTPPSTVSRWIEYLEQQQLVQREPHPNDKRIFFVRLLPQGRQAMTNYLTEMGRQPALW